MYKVRFDLGAPNPVRAGMGEENVVENMEDIPEDGGNIYDSNSTDQLLFNRINNLQSFLSERKTRLRAARRRSKLSSGLIASADLTIQNSRKCLQKAKDVRYGEIKGTIQKIKDSVPKEETTQGESGSRCEECHRITTERDKFWGLESDSEEEEFKNFNDHPPRRSMTKNSRTALDKKIKGTIQKIRDSVPKEETTQGESGSRCEECHRITTERDKFWGLESDSEEEEFKNFNDHPPRRSMTKNSRTALDKKNIGGASMLRPKGIAGRGTWATPAYVPPWEVDKFESKRRSSMHTVATDWELEKARFGSKKGRNLNLYFRKITLIHNMKKVEEQMVS